MSFFSLLWEFFGHVVFEFFLFGFLGFLVGLGVIIFSYKKRLLKRNNIGQKILVVLYYVHVPVIFAFTGAFIGTIHAVKTEVHKDVHAAMEPLRNMHLPNFQEYVDRNLEQIRTDDPKTGDLIDKFVTEENEDGSWWDNKVVKWGLQKLLNKAGESSGLDDEFVDSEMEAILHLDVDAMNRALWDEVEHEVLKVADHFFRAFYIDVAIFWFIFMLIPLLETTLTVIMRKQKVKKLAAAADTSAQP